MLTRRSAYVAIVILVLASVAAAGAPLSQFAVVDIQKVIESFPEDSQVFRSIERMREQYEERMAEYNQQINEVEMQILEASDADDENREEDLRNERSRMQEDQRTYHRIMTDRINAAWKDIREGGGIVDSILKAIEFVCVDNGYSAAWDISDKSILWYSQEIDITDKVITRLRQISR